MVISSRASDTSVHCQHRAIRGRGQCRVPATSRRSRCAGRRWPMTRPDPARAPDDLFDAIATLLEPGQREYFYQRMLYFRQLRPDDELLRIVEAIGFLALIIRDAPHAVAIEREPLEQLLATHRASVEATANAARAHVSPSSHAQDSRGSS